MTDFFYLDHFDDHGCAVLERRDGSTITVPVEWLPEEALESHALEVNIMSGPKGSSLVIRLVEGGTRA
jgi:hypothetical protein